MPLYNFEEIVKQIQSKKVHPIYVLQGEEPYFIDLLTQRFIEDFMPQEEKAFNQEVLYGKETNVPFIVDSLSQFPMGSEYRIVIVRNAQDLKDIENLYDYAQSPYESSILILSLSEKKLDGRKKLSTLIKAQHGLYEAKPVYENQLPGWIKSEVEAKGKKINETNAQLIADFLGRDLQKISNEINKTVIAIGDSLEINQKHIEDYIGINREFNVFELVNALFNKNAYKAQQIINYLTSNLNKQPFTLILGSLFNSFIKLYVLKSSNAQSDADIIKVINTKSISAIKEYKMALTKYSLAEIDYAMYLFKIYDQYSKGVGYNSGDIGGLLKELTYKLMHIKEINQGKLSHII